MTKNRESTNRSKIDLEAAVSDYYKDVYRFAYHLAKNADDAGDLAQFAYERLAMKADQVKDPGAVKQWLFSTLYRKFLSQKRRDNRFPEVEYEEEFQESPAPPPDHARRLDAKSALAALQRLEDDLRVPLSLFYIDQCSYKEIARVLGIAEGTVMSRLFRGKKKLKSILTAKLP